MRLPSKIVSYNESVFPMMIALANILKRHDSTVLDLCRAIDGGVSDCFCALDALFALGKIHFEKEVLHYVG